MEHQEIMDLLPLAALKRLDAAERAALDEHLAQGCEACAAQLRAFRETAAAIALANAGEDTESITWNKIEFRLQPPSATPVDQAQRGINCSPSAAAAVGGSIRRPGNARLWRAIAGMSVAVMLATVMVAIEFTRNLSGEVTYHRRVADELARRNDSLKRQLALVQHKLQLAQTLEVESHALLTRILLSDDAKAVRLGPLPPQPSIKAPYARGIVTISAQAGAGAMQVSGLPQLPPGRVYELWWIAAKMGPINAALFHPGPRGDAAITITLPPPDDRLVASAVTIEPEGGVPKPTGPAILKGLVTRPESAAVTKRVGGSRSSAQ
jgi:hypothetical protein